jgi:hypothetical protein
MNHEHPIAQDKCRLNAQQDQQDQNGNDHGKLDG